MSGQLTICFSAPASAPPAHAPVLAERPDRPTRPAGGSDAPIQVADHRLSRAEPVDPGLPALRLHAGYEMYRDETRTVIRRPGEARWGATVRTGPTTHRFVGAGADPAALWSLAGREAARAPAGTGHTRA